MRAEIVIQRRHDIGNLEVLGLFDGLGKLVPEHAHQLAPVQPPVGNVVQFGFKPSRETGIDITLEETGQERGYQPAAILGDQSLVFHAHVVAVTQHRQDGSVGRGAADSHFLHLLHQAGFGIAWRGLGEMLQARHVTTLEPVAFGHGRQHPAVVVLLLVRAFAIQLQKPVERNDRAGGAQFHAGAGNLHRDLIEFRRLHLAGDRPLPDQLVKSLLIGGKIAGHVGRGARHIGRPHGLVRFLRVLGFGAVFARGARHVVAAERSADMGAYRVDRLARHLHAVGSHIGDQPHRLAAQLHAFIKLLRRAHGHLRAHAQLAAGFLLQGRGGEGRWRVALHTAPFDGGDGKIAGLYGQFGLRRLGRVVHIELVEFLPVQMGKPRRKHGTLRRCERYLDGPVLARNESLDLGLALADQAKCYGLHAAGAAAAGQFAPQHRRQGEANQIIECAPGEIRLDQRLIQRARLLHRALHRGLGDFIERDALHIHAAQHMLFFQHGAHMPGNRLALPVRVGGEVKPFGPLQRLGNGADLALPTVIRRPIHGEVLVRPHGAVLRRQIAHMAETGQNGETVAKVLIDGFGLGGAFHDNDVRH
jgi:hypothetical protein